MSDWPLWKETIPLKFGLPWPIPKHVVVQTAPATRAAWWISAEPAASSRSEMVAGLRRLGFDKVFDTDFTADLTILEG